MAYQHRPTTPLSPHCCRMCSLPIKGFAHEVCKLSGSMDRLCMDAAKERACSVFGVASGLEANPECYVTPPASPMRRRLQADRLSQTICTWRLQTREGPPSESAGPQQPNRAWSPPAPGPDVVDFMEQRGTIPGPISSESEATERPEQRAVDDNDISISVFTLKMGRDGLEFGLIRIDGLNGRRRIPASLRMVFDYAARVVPLNSMTRSQTILSVGLCLVSLALGWIFPLLKAYFKL